MKQVSGILMFVGAVALGALADRWVLSPRNTSTTIAASSLSDVIAPSIAVDLISDKDLQNDMDNKIIEEDISELKIPENTANFEDFFKS